MVKIGTKYNQQCLASQTMKTPTPEYTGPIPNHVTIRRTTTTLEIELQLPDSLKTVVKQKIKAYKEKKLAKQARQLLLKLATMEIKPEPEMEQPTL
jgi:hypothetical protein